MRVMSEVNEIVRIIKKYLLDLYGKKIKQVILYGSFARSEATEDSDVDILAVVDDELNLKKVEEDLNDLLFEILIEKGELVTVMAIKETTFNNYKSPLLLNIKEEGITL